MADQDLFAGLKKKKGTKKTKAALDELEAELAATSIAAPAPADDQVKAAPVDDVPASPAPVPDAEPIAEAELAKVEDDLDFSSLKKKKKKSVRINLDVDEDDGASSQPAAPAGKTDAFGNFIPADAVAADEPTSILSTGGDVSAGAEASKPVAQEGDVDDFSDLVKKKKKKSGKKSTFDLEAFEKELKETDAVGADPSGEPTPAGSDDEMADVAGDDDVPEGEDPFGKAEGEEDVSKAIKAAQAKAWLKEGDRDYNYTELLGRFYTSLYASHPSLSGAGVRKRYTLAPPSMHRDGNKRSIFANVSEICKKMHRQPEHVIQFLFAELGTSGSVDGSGRLVIKGRFQQKQIENVLRRYIVEYVTCKTCKSPETLLTKEDRLYFMTCESCGSKRSVSAIKSGFQAALGKRRAMRAAAP